MSFYWKLLCGFGILSLLPGFMAPVLFAIPLAIFASAYLACHFPTRWLHWFRTHSPAYLALYLTLGVSGIAIGAAFHWAPVLAGAMTAFLVPILASVYQSIKEDNQPTVT